MGAVRQISGRTRRDAGAPELFVVLDGTGYPGSQVGGKAASLDRLVGHAFPVPAAAALTADAYRLFIKTSGLAPFLNRLSRRSAPASHAPDEAWRATEDAFLTAPLHADLERAIYSAWTRIAGGGPVAVRSSATAEDLAASSFAGQYSSFLEVEGPDAVEEAIRRVWASLWNPAARVYRRHMGISDRNLAMPVVIQEMIPADLSGVCFTVDPTRAGALRLEVVEGLGEALVSGQATPEVFQLTRPGLQPIDDRDPPPQLRRIARAALRVEEELGRHPQDVEWSIAGDEIFILQARPITTIDLKLEGDGFDTAVAAGEQYSPAGVGEMLPGVLPPLLWTINAPMVEDAFRRLFLRLGVLPEDLESAFAMVGRFEGQAALNISLLKRIAARMAGGSGTEIERQYLGTTIGEPEAEPKTSLVGRIAKLAPSFRALRLSKQVDFEAETFERIVAEVMASRPELDELLTSELLAYRARVRDLAAQGVAAEVGVATSAVAAYRALEMSLERWMGEGGSEWAQRVTRGAGEESDGLGGSARRLWKEFSSTEAASALLDAITGATPGDVEERIQGVGPTGELFLARLWSELESLGSSAVYGGATWDEQSYYVWTVLIRWFASVCEKPGEIADAAERDFEELAATVGGSTKWRVQRVLTGQVVDVRRRMLRRLASDARGLLRRRETTKAALLVLGGEERRATMVLADRLVRRRVIDDERDVELLADWELEEIAAGTAAIDRDELQARREAIDIYRKAAPLPLLVNGPELPTVESGEAGVIKGWAASPGRHRGRVRIVTDLVTAGQLQPGDVLVAPATDPSWTPLFLIAGAIVVERGGPLSHAAIVSRELGLPAVLNAQGATTTLRPGDLVEVDGTSGLVVTMSEEIA